MTFCVNKFLERNHCFYGKNSTKFHHIQWYQHIFCVGYCHTMEGALSKKDTKAEGCSICNWMSNNKSFCKSHT